MRVLVVGGGGREHALAWTLAADPSVTGLVCAPGNAGIARLARCVPADATRPQELLALAEREGVDLTVVGPELPLTLGVANLFAARGRLLLGPTRLAAELESSKAFAKQFMTACGVPTARYRILETADAALAALRDGEFGYPAVVKADGLAAGKGVIIAPDRASAEAAIADMMVARRFGDAGTRVVLEEYLEGQEASFFVLTDGRHTLTLPSAEDHKRAFDGDRGPNTGGMGAFAPSALIDPIATERILREIIHPVIERLREEGREFRGFLYAGLMITREGPKVVEFNVRLGDPEAQVVLPMLNEELAPLLAAAARGELTATSCRVRPEPHVGVVLASGGYPGKHQVGKPIAGLVEAESMPDVLVFHAGTARQDGQTVTAGGRVLTVVGRGVDYAQAIDRAYAGVSRISFEGMQHRTDIGAKAIRTHRPAEP
jgi:phosphoribosylamine--glycine ligase